MKGVLQKTKPIQECSEQELGMKRSQLPLGAGGSVIDHNLLYLSFLLGSRGDKYEGREEQGQEGDMT